MSEPVHSAPTPPQRPSAMDPPWYRQPWARRFGLMLGGGAMLALCPFLPWPPARAVCVAVGQIVSGAASISLPAPQADEDTQPEDGGSP